MSLMTNYTAKFSYYDHLIKTGPLLTPPISVPNSLFYCKLGPPF